MHLDLSSRELQAYSLILDNYEQSRAQRFIRESDKMRYIAAHGQSRSIFSRYLGRDPRQIAIQRQGDFGKPILADHAIYFNLSHSGCYALLALSLTDEIGIDIEQEREDKGSFSGIGNSVFSSAENKYIMALPKRKQQTAFFQCWTRKEAFIKAIGLGFSYDTRSFTVSIDPDKPDRFIHFEKKDYDIEKWKFFSFEPFTKTQAALACPFNPEIINFYAW